MSRVRPRLAPARPAASASRGRSATVALVAALAAVPALAAWALTLGDYPISIPDAVRAAFGLGTGSDVLVVREWRLPRVLAALVVGAALATSGALLQGLVRNPLAAPDVIGISEGAALSVVLGTVLGLPALLLPAAAFGGALAAAALLALLAWRRTVSEDRLVLMGIALHTALAAAVTFLVVRFPVDIAQQAVLWTVGSLYARDWFQVGFGAAALAVLLPAAGALLRPLGVLQLGDDLAAALGQRVVATRLGVLGVAVALAATGVAVGGPIAFVALAVPHMARFLGGSLRAATLTLTAALGALVVLAADVAAQYALGFPLPVGAVTATVGAPLFLWLLLRHHRSGVAE
ncbi:iron ABC transporter permease [Carbonactinospora thermoautotrophica]|uniref:FecCD family ABC transporter permease n=1 Tax=Carbonactinospora thermoautotrophica TaxID=1469144 RepID=UPI002271B158|nr:iron ABC transporter permease [Carbonactinospora thermoautotrophica]MCX9190991.1 iron ABC transporter permease [Carbonactinospora thermoautotrophica]